MQYDADAFAMKTVGANALARALVKLHRDYATTLTPSRLYSLFHYSRPHAGMRVAAILDRARKNRWPLEKPARAAFPGAPGVFDITGYLEPGPVQPVVMPVRRQMKIKQRQHFFNSPQESSSNEPAPKSAEPRNTEEATPLEAASDEPPVENLSENQDDACAGNALQKNDVQTPAPNEADRKTEAA